MALHFDFGPKNLNLDCSTSIKAYHKGFNVGAFTELAEICRQRMEELNYTPHDLFEMYKKHCELHGIKEKESDKSLLSKFCNMIDLGAIPKRLRPFILDVLHIDAATEAEALGKWDLRKKMAEAMTINYEADHYFENLALILRHADLIMEYREFAELQLDFAGYSFCCFGGRHVYLGELLNYYKHGLGVVKGGCPHCGGHVYNHWCCGSMMSGVRHNVGYCEKCGSKVKNDKGEFGSPRYSLNYELPTKRVPNNMKDNPWNVFYLVRLLKLLEGPLNSSN